jgi:predicted XRE-type DNA-binding protein
MENNVVKHVFIFEEDQQALSENLFSAGKFFRRGAKWLTAEELSQDAINQGLDVILEGYR